MGKQKSVDGVEECVSGRAYLSSCREAPTSIAASEARRAGWARGTAALLQRRWLKDKEKLGWLKGMDVFGQSMSGGAIRKAMGWGRTCDGLTGSNKHDIGGSGQGGGCACGGAVGKLR